MIHLDKGLPVVLVTGSRNLKDPRPVRAALTDTWQRIGGPITVLHGNAPGVDFHAKQWALEHRPAGIRMISIPAEWDLYGRAAGPKRNTRMVQTPGIVRVLAFPMGRSPGTRDCIRQARAAGLHVIIHEIAEAAA